VSGAGDMAWRAGGCHCRAVRFEVLTGGQVEAQACNCSVCAMTGFIHVIVPESRFRLTEGADRLTTYSFNTHTARHLFCSTCGVKSFYRPRSNPDGWSVNARCLDDTSGLELTVEEFDGRNWELHADTLAHLSKEPS
jgi:hypothetical protein